MKQNVKSQWTLYGEEGNIYYLGNNVCEAVYKKDGTEVKQKFFLKNLSDWIKKLQINSNENGTLKEGKWGN